MSFRHKEKENKVDNNKPDTSFENRADEKRDEENAPEIQENEGRGGMYQESGEPVVLSQLREVKKENSVKIKKVVPKLKL